MEISELLNQVSTYVNRDLNANFSVMVNSPSLTISFLNNGATCPATLTFEQETFHFEFEVKEASLFSRYAFRGGEDFYAFYSMCAFLQQAIASILRSRAQHLGSKGETEQDMFAFSANEENATFEANLAPLLG